MQPQDAELEFDSIEDTIEAFGRGDFIIVMDSPDRENEGDLIGAADAMTTSKLAFLNRYSSGIICVPMSGERCDLLGLPAMVAPAANADPNGTAYTVTVDAADARISTGVSAADRALTCSLLADPKATAATFRRPGHVLPLRARPGGVLERAGHTEAAVEFCRLAGRGEAGVIAELVDDGEPVPGRAEFSGAGMMRGPACVAFARRFGLKICTIEHLVAYRRRTEEINGENHGKVNGS